MASSPAGKLFLLDAYALIYRAHFALSKNPRINSKGVNTGAAMGFANSLLELLKKERPTHLGVAFDTSEPTFRHEAFPEYKAQRQEQPEEITYSVPIIKEMLSAMGIPCVEKAGFEADDLIGTLAKKAARQGFEVYMMTPDKDFGQLVEERIFLYKPAYMGNAVEVMGVAEVLAKWDVERVDQVVDMLGLQGDSVDNIPGIPGVGPKTASKLLAKYGTVEELVAHADELKGKQKERVIEFGQQGVLSKQLARIDVESPVDFEPEKLVADFHFDPEKKAYVGADEERLRAVFDELEFRTISKRVFGEAGQSGASASSGKKAKPSPPGQMSLFGEAPAAPEQQEQAAAKAAASPLPLPERFDVENTPHDYYLVDSEAKMKELAHYLSLQEEFAFDTETTSVHAFEAELVGLSFCYRPGEAYYVPVPSDLEAAKGVVALFKAPLESPSVLKIAQNVKYDLMVLGNYGVKVSGPLFDTMLAHYLLQPESRHNMDAMALEYLDYQPVSIESLIGKKGKKQLSMAELPPEDVAEYAAEDADITFQLKKKLEDELEQADERLRKLFYEIEMPLASVLATMEKHGVQVDEQTLRDFSGELEADVAKLEQDVYRQAGEEFNIGSPKQLGEVLFDRLKLMEKPKKTKTGQYATGEEILIKLAERHQVVADILSFRQLQKLKSTYVDALPEMISPKDGRIHTSYNQAVAATGRLSSNHPNLQNIPIRTERGREIRKAFVAPEGGKVLFSADYSQIELRIMAAFSEDSDLTEAFKQGRDIHTATAAKINKIAPEEVTPDMRSRAKTANFGIIYGISAFGLSQRLNIPRKEAAELIETYFAEFPSVKKYMDEAVNFAREHGYVETKFGRRRYLPEIASRNQTQRGFAERNAINAPIQGTAADVIKKAMVDIQRWLEAEKMQSKMILQVHDELVFEAPEEELETLRTQVHKLMEGAADLGVPLKVESGTGKDWLAAH